MRISLRFGLEMQVQSIHLVMHQQPSILGHMRIVLPPDGVCIRKL